MVLSKASQKKVESHNTARLARDLFRSFGYGREDFQGLTLYGAIIGKCEQILGKKCSGSAKKFVQQNSDGLRSWLSENRVPRKRKDKKPPTQQSVQKFISGSSVNPLSDEFLSSFEWRATRMMALKKYGARCQCCGASPTTGAVIHVDHIQPRKTHPHLALVIDNLQVLCHECNHGKGNWDSTDWRNQNAPNRSGTI